MRMAEPPVDQVGEGRLPERTVVTEAVEVTTVLETEALVGPDGKLDYPPAGNSIYAAILSRNEAVKDAKRLKTFLELRDKYVKKKVLFEDPLFPADDSSLYYSSKSPMKFEWKRPSVSVFSIFSLSFRGDCFLQAFHASCHPTRPGTVDGGGSWMCGG